MKEYLLEPAGIYYRTNSFKAGRPTLVFVHGLSGSSSAWIPYEQEFAERYNLLTFDLRGHGKSKKPQGYAEYAIEKFSDDLHALLQHLRLQKYILVSHSFGTLVVLEYFRKYGQTAEATIFFSPNYKVKKRTAAGLLWPLTWLAPLFDWLPLFKTHGRHINYEHYRQTGDWNIRRMSVDILNTSLRVYLDCVGQSYGFVCEELLSRIHIPTLIVHGQKDSIFPVSNAVSMSQSIPGCQLKIMENDNHILVLNDLAGSMSVIQEFVNTHQ